MLHLSQTVGAPNPERLKVLPMAGAAIKRKDISRPADAWRNPFVLVLPPLAEGSRGIKKYTLSAPTAELQVCAMSSSEVPMFCAKHLPAIYAPDQQHQSAVLYALAAVCNV